MQINCEAWIKKGDPKDVICCKVKRVKPDILIMGSRGLGPFHRYCHFLHKQLTFDIAVHVVS